MILQKKKQNQKGKNAHKYLPLLSYWTVLENNLICEITSANLMNEMLLQCRQSAEINRDFTTSYYEN